MKIIKIVVPVFIVIISGCKTLKTAKTEEIKTGLVTLKELKRMDWFKDEYQNYKISPLSLDSIRNLENFKIVILGGEWCSDTRLQLPRFIKILETKKFPMQNIKVIFVDRGKKCLNCGDHTIEKYNLKFVPTFIVYDKSGNEKGRIVESPQKTLEEDLLKIINQQ